MNDLRVAANRYFTPPEVATELRVNEAKVLSWIHAGELRAVNVAAKVGGRPRWRISDADIQAFLTRRSAAPMPKVTKRPKRKDGAVIEFF